MARTPKKTDSKGRSTTYRPSVIDVVESYRGPATFTHIGELLGVSTQTVRRWMEEHDDFYQAFMRARHRSNDRVIGAMYTRAEGYDAVTKQVEELVPTGVDDDGNKVFEMRVTRRETTHVPGDVAAQKHIASKQMPNEWGPDSEEAELPAGFAEMFRRIEQTLGGQMIDITPEKDEG